MSANFYHEEAKMRGGDLHTYWALGPEGVPLKVVTIYVTLAVHQAPVDDESAIVASVTSSKHRMVQGRCKLKYVIHIPIPLGIPHPIMEPVEYGIILISSSSTPLLRRQTVTAGGKPLAVALDGETGLNVNCWEGIKLPSGYVRAENTVMTQPALADAIDALVDIVMDLIIGRIMKLGEKWLGKALDKFFPTWKERAQDWLKQKLKDLAQPVTRILEKVIKDLLKKPLKAPADKLKKLATTAALGDIGVTHV